MGVFDWLFKRKKLKKEYHDNGSLSVETEIIDGQKNGYYKDYYESGEIKTEATFKDDAMDGECKIYFKNGNLSELSYYENGQIRHYKKRVLELIN